MAVSEQNIPGSGDLCIRCHVPHGWYDGHSTPTDGSFLLESEAVGVSCSVCHKMTNTDDSEWMGNQLPPFVANDGGDPPVGYSGSGMLSLWGGAERLGPYEDATAPHEWGPSDFHRSPNFCGSCHDVSNPITGDLAHNAGAQPWADPVIRSGTPGTPVETKAAFNNFPHQYGVVERTFSENMSSAFPTTRVAEFTNLPAELQDGSIKSAYEDAIAADPSGDYVDGTPRFFSCQTCHMPPAGGRGCSFGPNRADNPLHDLTGGNYWMPELIKHLDDQDKLRLGGGVDQNMRDAMDDGRDRALRNLENSAKMSVTDNTLRVVNLTGHKLISGYPEGRRMWLNMKWFDRKGRLVREDGEYGELLVTIRNEDIPVRTILDPDDPNTKIYEAKMGMTREWARQLRGFGLRRDLPLTFDRVTGEVRQTLGDLANAPPGTTLKTLHFSMNNTVIADNRIPPYGMSYEEARKRNCLPVPRDQYGDPGPDGEYNYFDEVRLNPPARAVYGEIRLMYQPTSWEYVQFLFLANERRNQFLKDVGEDLLDGWLATGMAEPVVMTETMWGSRPPRNLGNPIEVDPK